MRTGRPSLAIACVADSKPKYLFEALRLAQTIFFDDSYSEFADLYIGVFPDASAEYLSAYQKLGATVVELEKYTDKHGPSNKLSILKCALLDAYDHVALFDCDLLPVETFPEFLNFEGVQAKPADRYTLSTQCLSDVFALCGVPIPEPVWRTSIDNVLTTCYCNSGCIIFSKSILRPFVDEWFRLNNILLANMEILGAQSFFLDQASFCVCVAVFLDKFRPLPLEMNFPGHLRPEIYSAETLQITPKIVHYHDRVDMRTGELDLTGLPNVQSVALRVNKRTADRQITPDDNRLFWDASYAMRSAPAEPSCRDMATLALVRCVISSLQPRTILDLGCGTLCPEFLESSISYRGLDFSVEAIRLARHRFPHYSLVNGEIASLAATDGADLVLLLDVLPSRSNWMSDIRLETALALAEKALFLSVNIPDFDCSTNAQQIAYRRLKSSAAEFAFAGRIGSELFFLCLKERGRK